MLIVRLRGSRGLTQVTLPQLAPANAGAARADRAISISTHTVQLIGLGMRTLAFRIAPHREFALPPNFRRLRSGQR